VQEGSWPSGDAKPVAVLKAEPDELTERLNIKFTDGRDDLDFFREAAVRLESGRLLLLVRYQNAPIPGTQVHADSMDSPVDARRELLHAFGLNGETFSWVRAEP
jgi:hypothetical protein